MIMSRRIAVQESHVERDKPFSTHAPKGKQFTGGNEPLTLRFHTAPSASKPRTANGGRPAPTLRSARM